MIIQPTDSEGRKIGVLICGHGSRDLIAVSEFKELASKIKLRLPGIPFEYGFLEFARPIINDALDKLREQSVEKVIAIPAMLFAATHAKNDIPALLNKYKSETGLIIEYGRELGINSLMIGAAGARINEAINSHNGLTPSKTLLAVVGRGSSDPDANSNVEKITRMLVEGLGLGWGSTVYSGVTFPLVEPGLKYLVRLGFKKIVVFPYFLFSGVLIKRIREHTKNVADQYKEVDFINAGYLSAHPLVVENFLERISEVLLGENYMNCSLCKYRSNLLGFESEVGLAQESHHHHVEGVLDNSQACVSEDEKKAAYELSKKNHTHNSTTYPNEDHPLGPASLRF